MTDQDQDRGPADASEARGPNGPDRLLDHDADGIREYDNPMPGWWVFLFWATIVFAVLYFVNVPGIGVGKGRIASYEAEMARAAAKFGVPGAAASALSDADLLAMAKDPARLAIGKATFLASCSPCHRPDGGGQIGPNLTDEYWLHGGRPAQILKTVSAGVLEKGMPAWATVLKPEQLPAVVAYVLTLHDSHPPNPKAPQGEPAGAEPGEKR
jgi:cytochrome c oxidase cbb3-type subunit 3